MIDNLQVEQIPSLLEGLNSLGYLLVLNLENFNNNINLIFFLG